MASNDIEESIVFARAVIRMAGDYAIKAGMQPGTAGDFLEAYMVTRLMEQDPSIPADSF